MVCREVYNFFYTFVFDLERRAKLKSEIDKYHARIFWLHRKKQKFVLDPQLVSLGVFPMLKHTEYCEYCAQVMLLKTWDKLESGEMMR